MVLKGGRGQGHDATFSINFEHPLALQLRCIYIILYLHATVFKSRYDTFAMTLRGGGESKTLNGGGPCMHN